MTVKKKNIINLFLLILSISVVFFSIEIYLKNFYPQNLSGSWRIRNENGLITNKNSGEAKHFLKSRKELGGGRGRTICQIFIWKI